mgnify:CR=1 FL=1
MTTGDCIIETASPEATRRLGAALALAIRAAPEASISFF